MNVLASSPRKYVHPGGEYTASAAPLWRRGLASALDWGLAGVAYLLLLIPAGALDAIGELVGGPGGRALTVLGHVVAVSAVVAYFTFLLKSGHTMGMRALDIHVRAHDEGREPGFVRSLVRALLALLLGVAVVNAYSYLQGRPPLGEFSSFERAVGEAAVVVAGAGLLGQLWMLVDGEGRTLWDRLTGLVVVEDIVPTAMPDRLWSPWRT
ncbi:MAG TPA: RDD family protein [Gaiellaceae bacterium]|nr:RDD family protein [Gaiellaceae bacterium]